MPPQGWAVVKGAHTTGLALVPLMVIWPAKLMFTFEPNRTTEPAPIVTPLPAGIVTLPGIEIRESSGHVVLPLRLPLTDVQVVLFSMLIVLFAVRPGSCGE